MRARVRAEAPWWTAAFGGTAIMCWIGLLGFAWSDYDIEVATAARSLIAGDIEGFVSQIPAYGGSLILRSPFAGTVAALGGGELAVAAVLLGLAIATKAWAVLAIGPVLLALPERRLLVLGIAGTLSTIVIAPMWLFGSPDEIIASTTITGTLFSPWQLFWFSVTPARSS